MIEIGDWLYKLCNEPPQRFFWSDQGKRYIPHLVGSSQHLESNLGPTEYKAGVLNNQLWCWGTWWWEMHEFSNVWTHLHMVIKKSIKQNRFMMEQIFLSHFLHCDVQCCWWENKHYISVVTASVIPIITTVTLQHNHCLEI